MESNQQTKPILPMILRLCHVCHELNEGDREVLKCGKCEKSFLPLNYFERIRAQVEAGHLQLNPLPGLIAFW